MSYRAEMILDSFSPEIREEIVSVVKRQLPQTTAPSGSGNEFPEIMSHKQLEKMLRKNPDMTGKILKALRLMEIPVAELHGNRWIIYRDVVIECIKNGSLTLALRKIKEGKVPRGRFQSDV